MFTVPFIGWFVYLWQRKQLRDTLSALLKISTMDLMHPKPRSMQKKIIRPT